MIDAVIDISHFQGSPDFGTIRASGIVGVIHKATQGTGYTDPTYAAAKTQALAAGLLWGAYHFGTGSATGAEQAQYFLKVVQPGPNDLVVIDFETTSPAMTTQQLLDFITTIHATINRWPVVYGSPSYLTQNVGDSPNATLANCPLWIADYTTAPQPSGFPTAIWPNWTLWQYTQSGSIPGINGAVDRDRYNGTEADLRAWW